MSADYEYEDGYGNVWRGYAHDGWVAVDCEGLQLSLDQDTVDAMNTIWRMHTKEY